MRTNRQELRKCGQAVLLDTCEETLVATRAWSSPSLSDALPDDVQDALLAHANLLREFGPQLGRPRVDSLNGSRHANLKELRFDAADGVWRVAFAFDPRRQAVLLVAGDKQGSGQTRFYRRLIAKADARFGSHLEGLKKKGGSRQ